MKKQFDFDKAFSKASRHYAPVKGLNFSEHKRQLVAAAKEKQGNRRSK